MSLWQYYRNLSPNTRLLLGVGVIGYAVVGMALTDQAEKSFGFVPSEEDKQRLDNSIPKIHTVDRESKS